VYGPQIEGQQEGALKTQLEHFARCIASRETPLVSVDDARAAVAAACAIHESLETGQPVQLP